MRYTSALVLSTLVIGQAAAVSIKHAGFHARRHEKEEKRTNYDVSGVDWNQALSGMDWSSVFAKPTPVPSGAAQQSAAGYNAKATSAAVAAAAYTPAPAAASSASKAQSSSSSDNSVSNVVGNGLEAVKNVATKLGVLASNVNNADRSACWTGDDGKWKATFTNKKSETAYLFCWAANGYSGMSVAVNAPAVSVAIPSGQSSTVSFAENVPGACAPMFSGTTKTNDSMIANTFFEYTFTKGGVFDISREPNMNGDSLAATGSNSGCTSDMESCVFKCKDGTDRCGEANTYDLYPLENRPHGCYGGYDKTGTGGGCQMNVDSEHIQVTIS